MPQSDLGEVSGQKPVSKVLDTAALAAALPRPSSTTCGSAFAGYNLSTTFAKSETGQYWSLMFICWRVRCYSSKGMKVIVGINLSMCHFVSKNLSRWLAVCVVILATELDHVSDWISQLLFSQCCNTDCIATGWFYPVALTHCTSITDRHTHTHRQTHRQTHTHTDTHTHRQTHTQTELRVKTACSMLLQEYLSVLQ